MNSGFLKSRLGAAVIIGCLFLFGVLFFSGRKTERAPLTSIGSITALVGEADIRLPGALDFGRASQDAALTSGEQIVAHEAAQVTLSFNGGASVRMQPGARLVAEKDSSRVADGVLATLLEGDADVLAAGTGFRLLKNGRDVTFTGSRTGEADKLVVSAGGGRVFTATPAAGASTSVVTASTPVETPVPSAPSARGAGAGSAGGATPSSGSGDETGDTNSKDSLSNDEIRKSMGNEIGFYRRCYLTYLNRAHIDASTVRAATVTVGFTIANTGKVRDARVVRSDFNDATLNACVLETVERTPFRAFKATDIPVLEFPIELK